ncbi:MAG: TraV family lipoprotein, partial [Burkholderiaceae bacterium]|nr:TraV family lipoprotein [Burkholderiaceae bacterium]
MNPGRNPVWYAGIAGGAMALAGCTSVSGLDGSSSYACKAPEGVTCDSVSGTYANAIQNNLPSQRPRADTAGTPAGATALPRPALAGLAAGSTAIADASAAPMPLRSSARILRLWFKPWEDADRDLYDQGYVYVQIDSGQWLIEHAQRQIREAYAPLRPPPRSTTPEAASATPLPKGTARLP